MSTPNNCDENKVKHSNTQNYSKNTDDINDINIQKDSTGFNAKVLVGQDSQYDSGVIRERLENDDYMNDLLEDDYKPITPREIVRQIVDSE